jgi:hypothetical protein
VLHVTDPVVCPILMDLDEEWMTGRKYLKEEVD